MKKQSQSIMDSLVPFHVHSEFLENLAYVSMFLIGIFFVLEVIVVFNKARNRNYNKNNY